MNGPPDREPGLRRLLSDAVEDVEPHDRIGEIRASVRPRPRRLPGGPAAAGWHAASGVIATAAVIGIVAYVTHVVGDRSAVPTATATDTSDPTPRTTPLPGGEATVFYLGPGPHGTVLYREVTRRPAGTTPLDFALTRLAETPADPDYRTPWRASWLQRATSSVGLVTVELGRVPASRPSVMSARDAAEAVQQVVYTLEAATRRADRVRFLRHGRPVASVLGVDTRRTLAAGPETSVLSTVSIGSPEQGAERRPGALVVTGLNGASHPSIVVRLVQRGITYAEQRGPATALAGAGRMSSWRVTLDTRSLPRGRYTLVATDGAGQGRDTRMVYLR